MNPVPEPTANSLERFTWIAIDGSRTCRLPGTPTDRVEGYGVKMELAVCHLLPAAIWRDRGQMRSALYVT